MGQLLFNFSESDRILISRPLHQWGFQYEGQGRAKSRVFIYMYLLFDLQFILKAYMWVLNLECRWHSYI